MSKRKQKAKKERPEYRPEEQMPDRIDLDCGCELSKDMKDSTTHYFVSYFCLEHDPSLWENYAGEDEGE